MLRTDNYSLQVECGRAYERSPVQDAEKRMFCTEQGTHNAARRRGYATRCLYR
jgi:hypothetical protein